MKEIRRLLNRKELTFFTLFQLLVITLYAQPTINSFSPNNGPPGTLITINGTNLNNLSSVTIGGKNAIIITNSSSVISALVIPGTNTGTITIITSGGSVSSNSNFTVTTSKYPSVQEGNKLTGAGTSPGTYLGYSVAISADGNTAVVGGYYDNNGRGAAWIFIRSNGVWTQQAKLFGSGSIGTTINQGISVAINADGNTVLVGGQGDNFNVGAAWVFTRSGTSWTEQAKLIGSNHITSSFIGRSVSLSADGNTAAIGGNGDNSFVGATWVFKRNGSSWLQQGQKLIGSGAIGTARQGTGIALSADGYTIAVGGPSHNGNKGGIWIFSFDGTSWVQQGSVITCNDGIGSSEFGTTISVSADGSAIITGGPADNTNIGAAWLFAKSGANWVQQQKFTGSDITEAAKFGTSVSISTDGNIVLIGAINNHSGGGSARVFTNSSGVWSQTAELIGNASSGSALQGNGVALSNDGLTAIVGGQGDNSNIGGSWIFIPAVSALPLTLISFTVNDQNGNIFLEWTVADQINTSKFLIEHSTDGSQFQTIASIPAAGTNASSLNYSFMHTGNNAGINYYRLKMIDQDGKFTYSKIKKVISQENISSLKIFPNPATDKIIINHPLSAQSDCINIYNSQNQLLKKVSLAPSMSKTVLNIESFPSGIYTIEYVSRHIHLKQFIIKQANQ